MTIKTTISEDGRISIPKSVREKLHLMPGSEVFVDINAEPPPAHEHSDWRAMRGMFAGGPNLLTDLKTERATEIARDNARHQSR